VRREGAAVDGDHRQEGACLSRWRPSLITCICWWRLICSSESPLVAGAAQGGPVGPITVSDVVSERVFRGLVVAPVVKR
jgi:hypothetical protein